MKASELLFFVLDQQLNLESGCYHVFIDSSDETESQSEFIETFFGYHSEKEIPSGEYVYIYSDEIVYDCSGSVEDFLSEADLVLNRPVIPGNYDCKIYLFRIED